MLDDADRILQLFDTGGGTGGAQVSMQIPAMLDREAISRAPRKIAIRTLTQQLTRAEQHAKTVWDHRPQV